MTLLYNLVMLAVDIAVIRFLRRRGSLLAWCGAMASAGVFGLVLGSFLGWRFEDRFGVARLCAYGIFLHGVALLTATAVLWRRSRPWLAAGALTTAVAMLVMIADLFLIEPHWLEVSHRQIASPKIHHPVRIVVVADLQADRIGEYEQAVLRQTLDEKPDIILLAGDYLQTSGRKMPSHISQLRGFLREIHFSAPRGVFAAQGNVDSYNWQRIFEGLDITTIPLNQSFDLGELKLTCLGLYESYNPRLHVAYGPSEMFHLVLGHVPNFALGNVDADLLVAGHTHGGQVCIPGVGALTTNCLIPRKWASGLTELPGGRKLLISRGIGVERSYAPAMRFFCRPELMVIDLVPEGAKSMETANERR